MKVLSKFALFTALVVLSACAVAETPFKVYTDKDKSFKQIEKMLAGKSTKWENKRTQNSTDSAGNAYTVDVYSRVYTYKDGNDNFATANFFSDPNNETRSDYQTYTLNQKISTDGFTATFESFSGGGGATPIDVSGYTIYELTPLHGGSASTTQPRAIEKTYALIKIDGDKLSGYDDNRGSLSVDINAKTIAIRGENSDPMVYNKL